MGPGPASPSEEVGCSPRAPEPLPYCGSGDALLAGRSLDLAGEGCASRYAVALLSVLGAHVRPEAGPEDTPPAIIWARSGLMWLTGAGHQAGCMLPAPVSACANGVLQALRALGGILPPDWSRGEDMLAHRAALLGLRRQGRISAGGSCRLLRAAGGMLAVNLARSDDWTLLPAWLEGQDVADWDTLAAVLSTEPVADALERARLIGLPVAAADMPAISSPWCHIRQHGVPARMPRDGRRPRVLDLSSLWAGPLCGQILSQLGAQVIKVESSRRPDGARSGNPDFFNLMNAGKQCVAVDFGTPAGIARLRRLIAWADIVIDASRPRALRQLGIHADELVASHSGLSWISITGYGREEPAANWVAFGDDAGVAGGLSALLARTSGQWAFCGDAIGDPLTGLHAALAAWSAHVAGGGCLVSLAMRDVVAHCAAWELPASDEALQARAERWHTEALRAGLTDCRPVTPAAAPRARPHGADTAALAELLTC